MTTPFLITTTVIFFVLSAIWKKHDWLNLSLKLIFGGMMLWSAFLCLVQLGYIVHI
jgi:hypothetical protein